MRTLQEVIEKARSTTEGFNPPAEENDLARFQQIVGSLPEDVLALYRNHDGSKRLIRPYSAKLTARLIPIAEALENQLLLNRVSIPKAGTVAWLWTDDNSNYCGVYTDGLLQGFLTVLDHEDQILTPAFRSVARFMEQVLVQATDGEDPAYDISQLDREIPELTSCADHLDKEELLATNLKRLYLDEADKGLRRLYAICSICLTPFSSTSTVLSFLDDADWQIGPAAIRLLEIRRYVEAVELMETLARESGTHRGAAARFYLVRLGTVESRAAIDRLRNVLDERGRELLERLVHSPHPLPPPRW
ncbi:MAG: hypothetical protein ABSE46_18785 [Terracidiphilus sp.]